MRLLVVMAVQVSSNCLLRCTSTPRPTPRFKALSRHSTQRLSGLWPPKVLENLPNFIGTATLDRQQTLLILLDLWSPLDRPLVPKNNSTAGPARRGLAQPGPSYEWRQSRRDQIAGFIHPS